jgi:CBS domain-containing protein
MELCRESRRMLFFREEDMTKVKDAMTSSPSFILSEATIQEAAQKMQKLDCGFLPVGSNDKIIGIITDRDIAVRAVAQGMPPSTKVGDIASKKVLYCFENDTLEEVSANMSENSVRRLIVLSDKKTKRLVGVLSLGDVATAKSVKSDTLASLVKSVSQPNGRKSSTQAA